MAGLQIWIDAEKANIDIPAKFEYFTFSCGL